MRIDAHAHIWDSDNYVEDLMRESKRLKIDKTCLNGCPFVDNGKKELFVHEPLNDKVRQAFLKYPGKIIGFAYMRLGRDKPEMVDEFYKLGFKGLKVVNPLSNYDDKGYYPIYARAEKYKMPVLFHTGIVVGTDSDKEYDVSSVRQMPIYLDTIARAFPELIIIGAHLGIPWHEEACLLMQAHPNVYFDLTVSPQSNWWENKGISYLKKLLYWEGAWEKIVFGTDVSPECLDKAVKMYQRVLDSSKVPQIVQDKIFGGTMTRVLNLRD